MDKTEYLKLVYEGKQKTNEIVFSHSFQAATWSVGLYFAAAGYMYTWELFSVYHKALFASLIILFEFVIVSFILYCKHIHEVNAAVICKIDEDNGAFDEDKLLNKGTLYPNAWRNYGKNYKIKYYLRGMIIPSVLSALVSISIIIIK